MAVVTGKLVITRTVGTTRRLGTRNVSTRIVGVTAVGPLSTRLIVGSTGGANGIVAIRRRGIVNNLKRTIYSTLSRYYPAPIGHVNVGSIFNRDNPTGSLLGRFNLSTRGVIGRAGRFLNGWFGVTVGHPIRFIRKTFFYTGSVVRAWV